MPDGVKRVLSVPLDARRRAAIMQFVGGLDAKPVAVPAIETAVEQRLRDEFDDEITAVERMTGRDLSSWRRTTER
jgi:hypothetical protein